MRKINSRLSGSGLSGEFRIDMRGGRLVLLTLLSSALMMTACVAKDKEHSQEQLNTKTEPTTNITDDTDSAKLTENILLIDVRTPDEYAKDGLADAVLIPHQDIGKHIDALTGGDKSRAIKLYCRSGNRAGMARATLATMGYQNVENLHTVARARLYLEENPIR